MKYDDTGVMTPVAVPLLTLAAVLVLRTDLLLKLPKILVQTLTPRSPHEPG